MRRHEGYEWVVVPFGERDDNHHHYRDEDENLQRGGELAHHLDAANVDPGNDGDQCKRYEIVLPSRDLREVVDEVVGEENCIGSAEQERCGPVPPSGEESPKISEGGAGPAIEAAFDGH